LGRKAAWTRECNGPPRPAAAFIRSSAVQPAERLLRLLVSPYCPTSRWPRYEMLNHVRTARMILKRVGIAVLLTAWSFPLAAQQDSQSTIAAIKAEGLRSTDASVLFHTLTDTIGPRLTGSPAHEQAARWAVERLKAW